MKPPKDRGPAGQNGEWFVKVYQVLLKNQELNQGETLMVIALASYDWGDGRGCWPSNDTLAVHCRLKTDGPDRGHNAVRFLLKSLKDKGYVEIEAAKQCRENRTGRVLRLTAKANPPGDPTPAETRHSATPTPEVRLGGPDHSPRSTLRGTPEVRLGGTPEVGLGRIDSIQTDPGIDPSSGEDDPAPPRGEEKTEEAVEVEESLKRQIRKTFPDPRAVERMTAALPAMMALVDGKTGDPLAMISGVVAAASKARRGGEAGYALRCLRSELAHPRASSAPRPRPTASPPPAANVPSKCRDDITGTDPASAKLDARWDQLTHEQRQELMDKAARDKPALKRFKPFWLAAAKHAMDSDPRFVAVA